MTPSDSKVAVLGAMSRMADIPSRAGQWGVALSSIASAGWLLALLIDPTFPRWSSSLMLVTTFAPRWSIEIWVTMVTFLPMIGIAFGFMWLRSISIAMGLVLWLYMFVSAILLGPPFPSSLGIYLALFLACLNAESRYWASKWSAT